MKFQHFPNQYNIEVKFSDVDAKSYTTSYKQLDKIKKSEKNNYVVVMSSIDRVNGMDLIALFREVNDGSLVMNEVQEKITKLYDDVPCIFEQYKMVPQDCKIEFIDRRFLPEVLIVEQKAIISASFKIHAYPIENFDIPKYLKDAIGEGND